MILKPILRGFVIFERLAVMSDGFILSVMGEAK